MGHDGIQVSALFHGFDGLDLDQDTAAEERADQQKDRSSARIYLGRVERKLPCIPQLAANQLLINQVNQTNQTNQINLINQTKSIKPIKPNQ